MANNQDDANLGNHQPIQNDAVPEGPNPNGQGQHDPNPENQAIRAEMEVIRAQMAEVLRVLGALRDAGTAEATAAGVNPPPPGPRVAQALENVQWPPYGLPLGYTPPTADTNPEGGPSGTTGQAQPNPVVNDVGTRTPQVQIQIPVPATAPGTPVGFNSPATIHPQVQGPVPQIIAHPRDPHVAPAVASMNNPHYGVSGFPLNYPDEARS